MVSAETKKRADDFLAESLTQLRQLTFTQLSEWPDYPSKPPFDLVRPAGLERYTYTLMKESLPTGAIRVAIQRYRYRFLGIGEMRACGFVIEPGGSTLPLTQKDLWALT